MRSNQGREQLGRGEREREEGRVCASVCVCLCECGTGVYMCSRVGWGGDGGEKGRIEKKRRKEEKKKSTGTRRTEVFGYMI